MNLSHFPLKLLYKYASTNIKANTICALASGKGKCGISIIRVSGPDTLRLLTDFTRLAKPPPERRVIYKDIVNPKTGDVIDTGIAIWFPSPKSFTGEDVCEFQVHGSPAVVADLLEGLTAFPNVRIAEPGEFSRRAFYNGKLDLTEIEGLADLLQAETSQQRRQAYRTMKGKLKETFHNWRSILMKSIAHTEAYIDFSESDDIDFDSSTILASVKNVKEEMRNCINDSRKSFALKTGIQVPIYGLPNVGKSSFFNRITNSNRAIVSDEAGTTRDLLEKTYDISGFPVSFIDTAGIRNKYSNEIEKEGITRAVNALYEEETHIHILICSVTDLQEFNTARPNSTSIDFIKHYVDSMGLTNDLLNPNYTSFNDLFKFRTIIILNKIDLLPSVKFDDLCSVSCKENIGFDTFTQALTQHLNNMYPEGYTKVNPRLTSLRQKNHLEDCVRCLETYVGKFAEGKDVDYVLAMSDLRKGLRHLGFITGHVVNEEILDIMFEDFCVGK